MAPFQHRTVVLYSLTCDGCVGELGAPTAFEGEDEFPLEFENAATLLKEAMLEGWTTEGEGAEERWHCPACPPLGSPKAEPGEGQEVLPL